MRTNTEFITYRAYDLNIREGVGIEGQRGLLKRFGVLRKHNKLRLGVARQAGLHVLHQVLQLLPHAGVGRARSAQRLSMAHITYGTEHTSHCREHKTRAVPKRHGHTQLATVDILYYTMSKSNAIEHVYLGAQYTGPCCRLVGQEQGLQARQMPVELRTTNWSRDVQNIFVARSLKVHRVGSLGRRLQESLAKHDYKSRPPYK